MDKITLSEDDFASLGRWADIQSKIGDLYSFNKNILGYDKISEQPHRLMCDSVQFGNNRQLHLWPRGHFKTTNITVGYSLYELCKNPNLRIFIGNSVLSNAKSFLREIKGHLANNDKLKEIMGDTINKDDKWTEQEIILKTRTINKKEPTIQVAGVGQSLVSQHYDLMILDDLVDQDNVNTKELIQKTIDWYRMAISLLEPDGKIIVIGCLAVGSKVLMSDGFWKNIEEVKVGDRVFSYKDKRAVIRKVEAVIPQGKSKVFQIETGRHSLKATDRHPFLVLGENGVEWRMVKNLKIGDKVITSSLVSTETSKRYYDNRFLRSDFYYLLGFMYGDGWIWKSKKYIYGICIAKHVGDNSKILNIIKKYLGEPKETSYGYYRVSNAKAARWFVDNGFIGTSKTKRLPKWVFNQRACYKRRLIEGMCDSDGCKQRGDLFRVELTNKELVNDLYYLSLTCGIRPTKILERTRTLQPPNSKKPVKNTFYSIGLTNNKRQSFGVNQFNWRWERVKSIVGCGEEEVYDLTIEDTGNFISEGYVVHNTRYNYGDLYGWLIENHSDKFKPQVHSCFDENGDPIFPSRFTKEKLKEIRDEQGSFIFSGQYLNEPVDAESAKFKKTDFRYYTDGEISGKELYTIYMIDRAYSLAKTADFTAHVIVSIDSDNNWYVRLAKRVREGEKDLINRIFDNKHAFNVDKIGIEQKAFDDTIRPVLLEEMSRRGDYFQIEELKGRLSKITRIEALSPRFEVNKVFFLHGMDDLEDELIRFPLSKHDDLMDALAYGNDLAQKPTGNHKKKQPIYHPKTGRVIKYA